MKGSLWFQRLLALVAGGLFLSMFAAAMHDMSRAWDVWSYHLPFAARIAGIVPAEHFVFDPEDQARFAGFPLLFETLQGTLWRITGRAESANLVAFASLPLLAWLLRRRFDVPLHLSALGLLAIPLVHAHATSCYVDLPANVAASAVVLLAMDAWTKSETSWQTWALTLACAAAAINGKALLQPLVLVALALFAWRAGPQLYRSVRGDRKKSGIALLALAVALPLVFFTPGKNLVVHHNPYYPIEVNVLGKRLPGPEKPYASSPPWLEHAPRPARFAASLAEVGLRPMSDSRRWTIDQWMPPDADGYRMGGFFSAYVLFNLLVFAWRVVRDRALRTVRVIAIGFGLTTVVISMMPQSHELRYYMSWMILLVASNLWMVSRVRGHALDVMGVGSAAALAVVLFVTRAGYAYPSGETFDEIVHAHVGDAALRTVRDGDRICVQHAPWNLLWAAPFHAPRRYAVREAEEPSECGADPSL